MHKSNIPSIIQDFVKRINSNITYTNLSSLFITTLVLLGFTTYITQKISAQNVPFTYTEGIEPITEKSVKSSQLFASKNGKTYTYAWCSGASRILEKNKIFFKDEDAAKKTGRTLSKNCK